MMTGASAGPHLIDWELVDLVDGGGDATEQQRWAHHLAACPDCRLQEEQLRGRTRRFSVLLEDVLPPAGFRHPVLPARAHSRSRPWLKAAAVVLLLVASALAVTPLRAVLADWIASRWSSFAGTTDAEVVEAVSMAGRPAAEGAIVGFQPTSDSLTLEFAAVPAGGTLVLRRADGREVTIEIRESSGETPLVTEGAVRVQNSATSVATYEVGLPQGVSRVRVEVGGRGEVVVEAGPAWEGSMIDLRGGRVR